MTDNDAAKALEDVNGWIASIEWCKDTGDTFRYKDSEDVLYHHAKTIRLALTKSAKVDGLLEALKECDEAMEYMSEYDIPIGLPDRVKQALQRFNGEV